jgi:hypothetical protein
MSDDTSDDPILVRLEDEPEVYYPGDTLTATYQFAREPLAIREIEVSVLWHTEGKGDEDMGVHYFQKCNPAEEGWQSLHEVRRLTTQLPASPLSYEGLLIKIRWCVRVRAIFENKDEWLGEARFQLGDVGVGNEVVQ